MKTKFILAILFIIIFISGCTESTQEPLTNQQTTTSTSNTIEITASGFNPKTSSINSGETVTFTNKDIRNHWPASAIHPTHAVYPEDGGCIGSKFDSCKGLAQDETFLFTFNQKGNWKYHDHLNPSLTGTIIVQ